VLSPSHRRLVLFVTFSLVLVACGGASPGDTERGLAGSLPEVLFRDVSPHQREALTEELAVAEQRATAGARGPSISISQGDDVRPTAHSQGLPLPGSGTPVHVEAQSDDGAALNCVVAGTVATAGSELVEPLIRRTAELYLEHCPGLRFVVDATGDEVGYEMVCAGLAHIAGSTRAPTVEEAQVCRDAGITLETVPLAYQTVALLVNEVNPMACFDLNQIYGLTANTSQVVTDWSQLAGWPDPERAMALNVVVPRVDSAFHQRFVDLVLGPASEHGAAGRAGAAGDGEPNETVAASELDLRGDAIQVQSPGEVAAAVAAEPGAFGWVPYSAVAGLPAGVKVVAITLGDASNGSGCVVPSPESVATGVYPLAGPLQLVVGQQAGRNGSVDTFVEAALNPAIYGQALVDALGAVGFQPLEPGQLEDVRAAWQFR